MYIKIRDANLEDLDFILQLQKECYLSEAVLYDFFNIPPLKQDLKSLEIDLNNQKILVREVNERIVASVRGFVENGTCHVGRLIVDNEFQNKGFGKSMMNAIESYFKAL